LQNESVLQYQRPGIISASFICSSQTLGLPRKHLKTHLRHLLLENDPFYVEWDVKS